MAATEPNEYARQELLVVMEEIGSLYWGGRWGRGMDYSLWQMSHGGSADKDDWPAESLPTAQQLQRLRDLSERAEGWWARHDEDLMPQFVSLSIWRRHLLFSAIAIPLTFYLAWLFVIFITFCVVTFIAFASPTWSPLLRWLVGIPVGLLVFFYMVLCFSNWHRMLLCLLQPIYWLLIRRPMLLP
jgi:hypothetical protein